MAFKSEYIVKKRDQIPCSSKSFVRIYNRSLHTTAAFKQRTSNVSEPLKLLICLDETKFFTLNETICPRICSKSRLKNAKRPLPANVRRSETSLINLPIGCMGDHQQNVFKFCSDGIHGSATKKKFICRGGGVVIIYYGTYPSNPTSPRLPHPALIQRCMSSVSTIKSRT